MKRAEARPSGTGPWRSWRRRGAPVHLPTTMRAGVAGLLLVAGSAPWVWTVDDLDRPGRPATHMATLTPDGTDRYDRVDTPDGLRITAPPTNIGGNLRMLLWPAEGPEVADGESCATWTSQLGGDVQQGAALRIREGSGRLRAVTVTKNVFFGAAWGFNLHTWDTARAQPFEKFGSVVVPGLDDGEAARPLPWRFCARIRGAVVELKVWLLGQPEPAWGDRRWGGAQLLPAGWEAPGRVGWFVGHLPPGGAAELSDIQTAHRADSGG